MPPEGWTISTIPLHPSRTVLGLPERTIGLNVPSMQTVRAIPCRVPTPDTVRTRSGPRTGASGIFDAPPRGPLNFGPVVSTGCQSCPARRLTLAVHATRQRRTRPRAAEIPPQGPASRDLPGYQEAPVLREAERGAASQDEGGGTPSASASASPEGPPLARRPAASRRPPANRQFSPQSQEKRRSTYPSRICRNSSTIPSPRSVEWCFPST